MTDRLRAAAEAVLKTWTCGCGVHPTMGAALRELSAALAEPPVKDSLIAEEQEPVVWLSWTDGEGYGYWETRAEAELNCSGDTEPVPLYAAPPRREWRGLTDEERERFSQLMHPGVLLWVEAALKEKNGGGE